MPPKFISAESGPLKLEFLSHEDIASYDEEAGYSGAALEYAQRWHIHRRTISILEEKFVPVVLKLTNVERLVDAKATAREKARMLAPRKEVIVYESFSKYISRVFALVERPMQKKLQELALELSRTLRPSPAIAERIAPIEAMFYAQADSLLEQELDVIDSKVSKFLSLVPTFELARDRHQKPIRDSLARLCQYYAQARFAEAD